MSLKRFRFVAFFGDSMGFYDVLLALYVVVVYKSKEKAAVTSLIFAPDVVSKCFLCFDWFVAA